MSRFTRSPMFMNVKCADGRIAIVSPQLCPPYTIVSISTFRPANFYPRTSRFTTFDMRFRDTRINNISTISIFLSLRFQRKYELLKKSTRRSTFPILPKKGDFNSREFNAWHWKFLTKCSTKCEHDRINGREWMTKIRKIILFLFKWRPNGVRYDLYNLLTDEY